MPHLLLILCSVYPVVAHLRKLIGGNFQFPRGLLNECSRAAGTRALHQHLLALAGAVAVEEDCFHVFAANFADEAHVGMKFLDGRGDGHDFLDNLPSDERRDQPRTRSGEEDAVPLRSEAVLFLQPSQEVEDFLRLPGVVAFVSLTQQFPIRRGNRVLAGRTAHVEAADFS